MALIKAYLFAHGEKIALALVAILSLYSILGNLVGETRMIEGVEIDPVAIRSTMEQIRNHIESSAVQGKAAKAQSIQSRVKEIRNAGSQELWVVSGWDGIFYARLPEPQVLPPTVIRSITEREIPEDDYLPYLDEPINVQVRAGGKRVVVTWEVGPKSRWVKDVRAIIWRKTIGEAREGAKAETLLSHSEMETERSGAGSENRKNEGVFGREQEPVMDQVPGAMGESVSSDEKARVSDDELAAREVSLEKGLREVINATTVVTDRWVLLKANLSGHANEPDVEALLAGGEGEEEPKDDEEYQPEYFSYVDNQVHENTIYRYRVILYATPRELPEDYRNDKRFEWYSPFLRVQGNFLALSKDEVVEALKKQGDKTPGARAQQVKFLELVREEGKRAEEESVVFYNLPENMQRRKTMALLSENPGYTPFAWSPYVLTPVRTSIRYQSQAGSLAMFKVSIVDDQGESFTESFQVERPAFTPPATVATSDREYYSSAGFPQTVKPSPIGGVKRVKIKSGGYGELDFSTPWGLVDIRECKIEVKQYTLEAKTRKDGKPELDSAGEPVIVRKYSKPNILPSSYCVLMEIKEGSKELRFKRVLRHRNSINEEVTIVEQK